jgi:DNA-binding winged helix-turn-helix (wHTH) protein
MVSISNHSIPALATREPVSSDREPGSGQLGDLAGETFMAREGELFALISHGFSHRKLVVKVSPGAGASHNVRRTLRFGHFELSVGKRVLRRDGATLPLGDRAFDILVYLAERPGEVIRKKELIDHVWSDVTVGEGNLRVHVVAIRKVLGDGQCGNRYIANVRGIGYSFIGSVVRVDSPEHVSHRPPERPDCAVCLFHRRGKLAAGTSRARRRR